jgi:hypothetical protein
MPPPPHHRRRQRCRRRRRDGRAAAVPAAASLQARRRGAAAAGAPACTEPRARGARAPRGAGGGSGAAAARRRLMLWRQQPPSGPLHVPSHRPPRHSHTAAPCHSPIPQVAWDNAEAIAAEMLALVQVRRRGAPRGRPASLAAPPRPAWGAPPPPPPAPPAGPLGVTGCPSFQLPACGRLLWPTPPISGPLNPHPQKAASPYIKAQWAWASVCNLTKMTSVKREAFPISFEVRPPTPPGVVASTRAAACAADGVRCARAGGAPPLPGASRRPRPARRFDPWTRTRRWSVSCARRWPLAARPPPLAAAQPPTPPPHPPPLQALAWIVREALTPLNFVLAVEAAVWFVERAAAEHPDLKVGRGPPRQGWA